MFVKMRQPILSLAITLHTTVWDALGEKKPNQNNKTKNPEDEWMQLIFTTLFKNSIPRQNTAIIFGSLPP